MAKYRKKPVVIEAMQWTGHNAEELKKYFGETFVERSEVRGNYEYDKENLKFYFKDYILTIKTLEGNMLASKGDYIIRGVDGEYYPCKPDIFEKTYEDVGERPYWYFVEYEYFICSECGEWVPSGAETTAEAREMLKNGKTLKYCPNCGARMGVTE